ncbi:actin [Entamoeba marina]
MYNNPLILDIGTTITRAGHGGDDYPLLEVDNIIGTPKYETKMFGFGSRKEYVNYNATHYNGHLRIKYPVNHNVYKDFKDFSTIIHHSCYNELRKVPEEHPFILTDAVFNPTFNQFSIPAVYMEVQDVLSMYCNNMTNGIVLQSGGGVTSTVPVANGFILPHAITRYNYGGMEITDYLLKLLRFNGVWFESTCDYENIYKMKKKCCYIAVDYDEEVIKSINSSVLCMDYTLPDGSLIKLNNERFQCAEGMFDPTLLGFEYDGVHQMIYESVMKCDDDIQNCIFNNIVLSGGNTMLKGFKERFELEIKKLVLPSQGINVNAPDNRNNSPWIGGSILSLINSFKEQWVPRSDYDEFGPSIVKNQFIV